MIHLKANNTFVFVFLKKVKVISTVQLYIEQPSYKINTHETYMYMRPVNQNHVMCYGNVLVWHIPHVQKCTITVMCFSSFLKLI